MPEQMEFDFGVPVAVINTPEEFKELPDEVAKRRVERLEAKPKPIEVPDVPGQAKAAVIAEVHGINDLPFTFDGETYWVPPIDEWDIEVFEHQEDGKLVSLVKLLLGEKQWERFKSEVDPDRAPGVRRRKKRTITEMLALLDAATKATGTQPGE